MIFNLSNILLVVAIDIAGLAVAFPVGVGLAMCIGVVTTYLATRQGQCTRPCSRSRSHIDRDHSRRSLQAASSRQLPVKGIVISVAAGLLMGWFYSFVAQSMGQIDPTTKVLEAGKLSPYTAIVLFSAGVLLSNFLWNSILVRSQALHRCAGAVRGLFYEG